MGSFTSQGIQFIAGIVLARLLTPREFGLIGMLTVFIAISQVFIDTGFSSALIRKKECTESDYSTLFFFNTGLAVLVYLTLCLLSHPIGQFFHESQLPGLLRILALGLIFNALSITPRTILTRKIDFKIQGKVVMISSMVSGILAIGMAWAGLGVWSLVALTLSRFGMNTLLLWFWTQWKPVLTFSKESFREMFSFGSRLLASGLIDSVFRNIYYLVIGKYFSAQDLGFYTRADQFQALPSENLNGVISRVSFPVLATMQHDLELLKTNYKKLIKTTMFVTFMLMLGMAAIAEPMIIALIGEQWRPAIIYLQLLSLSGMFFPLQALNLNILQVLGRSDLLLRIELIKKIIAVPPIILGILFGIKILILGILGVTIVSYYLNSYYSGRFIGYPFREQVFDIFPFFLLALSIATPLYILSKVLILPALPMLLILLTLGSLATLLSGEVFKIREYRMIKETMINKLTNR